MFKWRPVGGEQTAQLKLCMHERVRSHGDNVQYTRNQDHDHLENEIGKGPDFVNYVFGSDIIFAISKEHA